MTNRIPTLFAIALTACGTPAASPPALSNEQVLEANQVAETPPDRAPETFGPSAAERDVIVGRYIAEVDDAANLGDLTVTASRFRFQSTTFEVGEPYAISAWPALEAAGLVQLAPDDYVTIWPIKRARGTGNKEKAGVCAGAPVDFIGVYEHSSLGEVKLRIAFFSGKTPPGPTTPQSAICHVTSYYWSKESVRELNRK